MEILSIINQYIDKGILNLQNLASLESMSFLDYCDVVQGEFNLSFGLYGINKEEFVRLNPIVSIRNISFEEGAIGKLLPELVHIFLNRHQNIIISHLMVNMVNGNKELIDLIWFQNKNSSKFLFRKHLN